MPSNFSASPLSSLPPAAEQPLAGAAAIAAIRADRLRLPRLLRRLHRIQTAIADRGEPIAASTPLREAGRDLALLAGFAATAAGAATFATAGGMAAPFLAGVAAYASLGVTGRLRRIVVGHVHEAGHGTATSLYIQAGLPKAKARAITEAILDIGTSLTLTQNGQTYRRLHRAHHEEKMLGTAGDPDGADLKRWGFWVGLPQKAFMPKLLRTLASPVWHSRFLAARLASNFVDARPARRLMGAVSLVALAGLGFVLPPAAYLAAIVLPWTVLYQAAALLQVLTEHRYGYAEGARTLADYAQRTWERVPYEPMPAPGLKGAARVRAWARWTLRLAFIHLPTRLAVLDSTMIAHSYHHTAWPAGQPFDDWWATSERMIAARDENRLPPEAAADVVFGIDAALKLQRAHMSTLSGACRRAGCPLYKACRP